jgi:hypothetical protein
VKDMAADLAARTNRMYGLPNPNYCVAPGTSVKVSTTAPVGEIMMTTFTSGQDTRTISSISTATAGQRLPTASMDMIVEMPGMCIGDKLFS